MGNVECFKWNVLYIIHNIFYYIIECYLSFVKVSMIGRTTLKPYVSLRADCFIFVYVEIFVGTTLFMIK